MQPDPIFLETCLASTINELVACLQFCRNVHHKTDLGTISYWCLVPNVIVIITFSIVDESLCNALSKLSFWKESRFVRKTFEKIECKHTVHLRQCNNELKLLQFPAMRSEHLFKGKPDLTIIVAVINRMTTKTIPVHEFGVVNLHQLSFYMALPFCLWKGCQTCVCHDWCMLAVCHCSKARDLQQGTSCLNPSTLFDNPHSSPACGQGHS